MGTNTYSLDAEERATCSPPNLTRRLLEFPHTKTENTLRLGKVYLTYQATILYRCDSRHMAAWVLLPCPSHQRDPILLRLSPSSYVTTYEARTHLTIFQAPYARLAAALNRPLQCRPSSC